MIDRQPLLRVEHLTKHFLVGRQGLFGRRAGVVHAVDDVSFELGRGEVLGLVGESGCGKSTLGMTIAQLVRRTAGHVYLDGVDLAELGRQELRVHRRKLQVVFQDPYSSLDPRMKVADIIAEPLRVVGLSGRKAVDARVHELLGLVRLNSSFAERYPHELSGGQRQRVGIARALALEPQLIICDEPVSALDASIQAQIVNLLQDLRAELGLSYLFIAHDVSVVAHISDRTAVMYLGRFAELANSAKLVAEPAHPYTRALLAAVPLADPEAESRRTTAIFDGDVPSPVNPPSGCRFRTRCPMAREVCAELLPPLREISKGHHVACHLV